jgi:hypothetical protein
VRLHLCVTAAPWRDLRIDAETADWRPPLLGVAAALGRDVRVDALGGKAKRCEFWSWLEGALPNAGLIDMSFPLLSCYNGNGGTKFPKKTRLVPKTNCCVVRAPAFPSLMRFTNGFFVLNDSNEQTRFGPIDARVANRAGPRY